MLKKASLLSLLFLYASLGLHAQQATGFTLSTAVNLNTALNESSGLEYVRGKLWTHNDSGGEPKIYRINPTNGAILQTITLAGVTNVDWEDLAADGYYLYIADTGNNGNGARTNLVIYKINLDDIPLTGDYTIPNNKIEQIKFYYPEQGTSPSPSGSNNTSYDCEAILIRNDIIHLFTKDWVTTGSSEYLIPNLPHPQGEKYPAKFFHRYTDINFLVTGADNAGINQVALIGYQNSGTGNHYVRIYSGFSGDETYRGSVYPKDLGNALNMGQVEGICFGESPFTGYISNEYFERTVVTITLKYEAKLKPFTITYSEADKLKITTGTTGGGKQGGIRYNTDMKHLEGFNGLYWVPLDIVIQ
jgi:hypothetical protein